ncbi:MAG: DUF1036 domain-containing protein [Aliishimia sp.]
MKIKGLSLFCAAAWLAVLVVPAKAQFAVCNQSFDVVNVSIGQLEREVFRTRGWWRIGPNQCANVIRDEISTRYVYVFAKDVFGKEIFNGTVPMCVAPDRFVIDGEQDCLVRGHLPARFIEVDTQETERWTLFVTARPE